MHTLTKIDVLPITRGIVSNITSDMDAKGSAYDIVNFIFGRNGELLKIPIGMYINNFGEKLHEVIPASFPFGEELLISTESGDLYDKCYSQNTIPSTPLVFPSQKDFVGDRDLWEAGTDYVAGNEVKLSTSGASLAMLRCLVDGTSGSSEPTFTAGVNNYGDTFTDGGVTWEYIPYSLDSATMIEDSAVVGDVLFLLTGGTTNFIYTDGELKLWGRPGEPPPPTVEAYSETNWEASTIYDLMDIIEEQDGSGDSYYYRVVGITGGGASGSSKPIFPTVIGETVVDNEVTWKCESTVTDSMDNQTVRYVVTMYDGYAEGNPSTPGATSIKTNGNRVKVTIPSGSEYVTQVRLYRYSPAAQGFYFLHAFDKESYMIPDNTTFSFIDGIANQDLGEPVQIDNDPPPSGTMCEIFKNHMFISDGDSVRFSKLGNMFAFPYDRELFFYSGDDGSKIVGLVALDNMLLVFKEHSLFAVSGNDRDSFQIALIGYTGLSGKKAYKKVGGNVFFVSHDGIYVTNGGEPTLISEDINNFFKDELPQNMANATMLYAPVTRGVYINIPHNYEYLDSDKNVTYWYDNKYGRWTRVIMGINSGGTLGNDAYFALGQVLYKVQYVHYDDLTSWVDSQWLRLADSVDLSVVRYMAITAGQVDGTIDVYYRQNYSDDWALIKQLTFTGDRETKAFKLALRQNELQIRLKNTGKTAILYGVSLGYYVVRPTMPLNNG